MVFQLFRWNITFFLWYFDCPTEIPLLYRWVIVCKTVNLDKFIKFKSFKNINYETFLLCQLLLATPFTTKAVWLYAYQVCAGIVAGIGTWCVVGR